MRWPHWLFLSLICLLLAVADTAVQRPPAPLPRRPIPITSQKQGVHLLLDDGRHQWPLSLWEAHLRAASEAVGGGGYVTELVRLDDLDGAKWQYFMDLCATLELIPILRLATTYDLEAGWWIRPPLDEDGVGYRRVAARYARFVAELKWPGESHFVVVGNEPNHGDEWGGRPDAAAYGRFLLETAVAVKTADPQARVFNAALDAFTPHSGGQPLANGMVYLDAETFLDQLAAAYPEALQTIDGWASHVYTAGFAAGPWQQQTGFDYLHGASNPAHQEPPPGMPNRGVNGYEWELWKLETLGIADLPVLITETGWRYTVAEGEKGDAYPSPAQVSDYLDLALKGNEGRYPAYPSAGWLPWQDDPRVIAVTPFAFNGHPAEWGHTSWLQMDATGQVAGELVGWGN